MSGHFALALVMASTLLSAACAPHATRDVAHSTNTRAALHRATVNAVLSNPVDTRQSKPGDPVSATAVEPLQSAGITIPKHARLLGQITLVRVAGQSDYQSILGM